MGALKRIVPHLWYDKEAREAAEFYCAVFPDSTITNVTTLRDTPSGDCDVVSFELAGQPFVAISAGPLFRFNPSVSFLVACRTKGEVDDLWRALSEGGAVLMPLDAYPFNERYGWTTDRYGLSWQVMHAGDRAIRQAITPTLMFTGKVGGKTEEAITFYTSVFRNARVGHIVRYGKGEEPDREGTVKHATFELLGQQFAAMDSARAHPFAFNEAISLMVSCDTQEEIDYYWSRLSYVLEAEQCGWLKDPYGLSWQIVPSGMDEMMRRGSREQIARVTQAFLAMKKFDLAALQRAYEG
ncbi:MAG: VOC family protein [Armatimonadota bacterium]|nr:VOC family protein [Armatimonadota bacterium]MDR7456629.1 VOC family protein [Armatimonadota bacterium]MDR7495561.1 VOC family protein [Armatimonadota bacterium]MDR7510730.1 VOC family protein [Armatimonadota bacterium]